MVYTMDMWNAQWEAIKRQRAGLRKLNGMRIVRKGYEYRITYHDSPVEPWFDIDYRRQGTRNFMPFRYCKACDVDANGALERIKSYIYAE